MTPFNFTAIGGNLPTSAALMGNTVVWKPASTAAYARALPDEALRGGGPAAGRDQPRLRLGRGGRRPGAREPRPRRHPLHRLDRGLQRHVADGRRRTSSTTATIPRIVGETGGKDFIVAHPSADVDAVATAIVRGSFEYQGQKCSAASRVFAPSNLWPELRDRLVERGRTTLKVGDVTDFGNFMGAVIDAGSFKTQKDAIDEATRRAATRQGARRRRLRRLRRLVRRADGDRDDRPRVPDDEGGALRPRRDRVRLRREAIRRTRST